MLLVLFGMVALVVSQQCFNGTLYGRGERLRRKGFLPVATFDDGRDDGLEFTNVKKRPPSPLTLNARTPAGGVAGMQLSMVIPLFDSRLSGGWENIKISLFIQLTVICEHWN